MKRLFLNLCVLTLASMAGCGSSTDDRQDSTRPASDRRASDGVTASETAAEEKASSESAKEDKEVDAAKGKPSEAKESEAGEAERTFSLSVPFESVALTQGEDVSVRIGINRGTNFGEEVEIEVTGLPKGVSVESDEPTIEQGSTGLDLTFKATGDAALGDFTAKVTGRTESSTSDFTEEIKLIVSQAKQE